MYARGQYLDFLVINNMDFFMHKLDYFAFRSSQILSFYCFIYFS